MRRCLRAAARLSPRLSRQSWIESPAIAQRPLNQTQRLGATSKKQTDVPTVLLDRMVRDVATTKLK